MGQYFAGGRSREQLLAEEGRHWVRVLSKHTHFAAAELEEFYKVFSVQYPVGHISREVFVRENIECHGGAPEMWHRVFDFILDAEDAGWHHGTGYSEAPTTVSFYDLIMWFHARRTAPLERRLRLLFSFIDVNNDGLLQQGELALVVGWIYTLHESHRLRFGDLVPRQHPPRDEMLRAELRAARLISRLDVDGDGCINEDEFIEGCRGDQGLVEFLTTPLRH